MEIFNFLLFIKKTWRTLYRLEQPSRSVLKESWCSEGVQKLCSKFTGEHPCQIVISIKLVNHTSTWLFFCKFAAYFQNNLFLYKNTSAWLLLKWSLLLKPFKRQFYKMVKHTQAIRRQIADDLFGCVWPFCWIGA